MALVVALGGVAAVALLLAAMIVRQLRPGALPGIALVAAACGTAVAVVGRLQGHGQDWAYGTFVQAAMLAAVCAVAAAAAPSASPSAAASGSAVGPASGSAVGPASGPAAGSAVGPASGEAGPVPLAPHRATVAALGPAVPGLPASSRPTRTGSTRRSPSTRCASSGPMWTWPGRCVLDVGGGPGYFATEFRARGAAYIGLDPPWVTSRPRGAAGPAWSAARHGAAGAVRRRRRLLLVERPRARGHARGDARRDGAGDPAGRDDLRVVHPVAVAVGRARDVALALAGGRPRPAAVRAADGREPKNRFRQTLFPVSAARAMRWARAGAGGRSSMFCPVTTRGGRTGWPGCRAARDADVELHRSCSGAPTATNRGVASGCDSVVTCSPAGGLPPVRSTPSHCGGTMRSRVIGAVLCGLGVLALVFAAGLAFVVGPRVERLPYDLEPTQSVAEAPDATFLQISDGRSQGQHRRRCARRSPCSPTPRRPPTWRAPSTARRWCGWSASRSCAPTPTSWSARTALARAGPRTAAAEQWERQWLDTGNERQSVDYSGQIYKFPFGTEKKTYEIFDRDILATLPAKFVKTEEINGLETYQFTQEIRGGRQEVPDDRMQVLLSRWCRVRRRARSTTTTPGRCGWSRPPGSTSRCRSAAEGLVGDNGQSVDDPQRGVHLHRRHDRA